MNWRSLTKTLIWKCWVFTCLNKALDWRIVRWVSVNIFSSHTAWRWTNQNRNMVVLVHNSWRSVLIILCLQDIAQGGIYSGELEEIRLMGSKSSCPLARRRSVCQSFWRFLSLHTYKGTTWKSFYLFSKHLLNIYIVLTWESIY